MASQIIHVNGHARKDYRILVPVKAQEEVEPLMVIASALARARDGEITALSVINPPDDMSITEGRRYVEERKKVLKAAEKPNSQTPLHTVIRQGPDRARAICDAVEDDDIDLVILGWERQSIGHRWRLGSVIDRVLLDASANVAVLRLNEIREIRNILLPTAGGPHAKYAARLGADLARSFGARLTVAVAVHPDLSEKEAQRRAAPLDETLEEVDLDRLDLEKKVIRASSVPAGIVKASQDCDLVMIGVTNISLWRKAFFGTIPNKVATLSKAPVLMVKRYQGPVVSWFHRLVGQ